VKRLFALFAAFVMVASVGATFNMVQAGSSNAPDITTTPSVTPTEIQDTCVPPPAKPELIAPKKKAVIQNKTRVKLRWEEIECANNYRYVVRRDAPVTGPEVAVVNTKKTKGFVNVEPGYSYFWYVKACINKQCSRSKTQGFSLPPPPTPTPTATPTVTNTPKWTATPKPGNPGGTPVPGNPPGNLNDYRGYGVYLSDDGSRVYYADCLGSYVRYNKGSGIATIALWFYPGESVSFESRTLPGLLVQKGSVQANDQGYTQFTFDSSSWPGEHYHINFTGGTSKVNYCGHFQLMTNESGGERQEFPAHTPEELERIRQAGIESE